MSYLSTILSSRFTPAEQEYRLELAYAAESAIMAAAAELREAAHERITESWSAEAWREHTLALRVLQASSVVLSVLGEDERPTGEMHREIFGRAMKEAFEPAQPTMKPSDEEARNALRSIQYAVSLDDARRIASRVLREES